MSPWSTNPLTPPGRVLRVVIGEDIEQVFYLPVRHRVHENRKGGTGAFPTVLEVGVEVFCDPSDHIVGGEALVDLWFSTSEHFGVFFGKLGRERFTFFAQIAIGEHF